MTSNMTIYEGAFVNIETNDLNENIQQLISVRLFDTESDIGDTPFNVRYRVSGNGDGTQNVIITWDPLPEAAISSSFGYDDGTTNTDIVTGLSGYAIITIPDGNYTFSFLVDYASGTDPRYQLGEGNVIDLEMTDTPLKIVVADNAEDKFTPVKSKQAEIQIYSSSQVDISLFADGGDNRFYVEVFTQSEGVIFKGFLSISDLSQEFMPDPNVIQLIATDGLGFLRDAPLVNFENEPPQGIHPIISFLSWALAKTGNALHVKACMNIREETAVPLVSDDSGVGHFYSHQHIDARTFEKEIGECEDCFTVLEKILGQNSFLTQYRGNWVILRIDEIETGHEYFFTRFNHLGEWVNNSEETFIKNIGDGLSLSFMNDDAQVTLERPCKESITIYKYDYPGELLCNINFERGEVRTEPDLTAENSEGTYDLDCWTKQKFPPTGTTIIPADNDAYIVRNFELGYEKGRYVVLTAGPGAALEGIMSQPVPVSEGDRISLSVDWKLASNVGSGDGTVAIKMFNVLLLTDAGEYYYAEKLSDDPAFWQGPFANQNNTSINHSWNAGDTDETQWTNISVTVPAAPVSGNLYIGLFKEWQGPGVYEVDTHFSNLQLDITPIINDSYERYTGQSHTVSVDNPRIKAVREAEVFISDAPRVAMKGALLKEGAGREIYDGEASFGSLGQFEIEGDVTGSFPVGGKVSITGSGSNNITVTITDVNYSLIGDITTIQTDGETTTEIDADVVISITTYVLSGLFYNAAKLTAGPGGPTDLSPFGQLQSFDIWNQYNRVMRRFEGTIDKTDSSTQLPDLLHKYRLQDINKNTTDGTQYRLFMLLHFEMNMHMCEWSCLLHEVVNTAIEKTYTGHEFKYITDE
jgi:hypothetical protein